MSHFRAIGPRGQNRTRKTKRSNVISLQKSRAALQNNYPGFENKTIVFDDRVSLASAELVAIDDIRQGSQ